MIITFHQNKNEIQIYDFLEIAACVELPSVENPFTHATFQGEFQLDGEAPIHIEGFCDALDGSIFRIRFMPREPGEYSYRVTLKMGECEAAYDGKFSAVTSTRKGLLRVDAEHPFHFVWENTGEHYFWSGTTTYLLMGWDDENIRRIIDRLHILQVNRLRVIISGRVHSGEQWGEPVYPSESFQTTLNPWIAERPDDVDNPGFNVTRFNVSYWQKYERMLEYARERDVIISVIFYLDGAQHGVDPFKENAGNEDEQRYYRYAAARLSAFSNITWDITNEYHLFRNEDWVEKMGALLQSCDPYQHLMSVHGHGQFPFRTSPWADFAMYQAWDENGGYKFMLKNRHLQLEAGRAMPQINEEYGYEDHYPSWGADKVWPARSADNRRRLAWQIAMAGCYQTTGERADNGKNYPDAGGWINGMAKDDEMLRSYAHMKNFFERIEWWKLAPQPDAADNALCLVEDNCYIVYLPEGGSTAKQLSEGEYNIQQFNPRTGEYSQLENITGSSWESPAKTEGEDWVFLLQRVS